MRPFQRLRLVPRFRQGLLLSVLCATLIEVLFLLHWLDGLRFSTLDALFWARGPRFPSGNIVLLVADDATVARVGRWPLPRSIYADVVERLQHARVKTIAFDILFSTPAYTPEDDARLAHACNMAQRVIQAAVFHVPLYYNPTLPVSLADDSRLQQSGFNVTDHHAPARPAVWATSAIPALQHSASLVGHINIRPEADGALRHIPHLIRYKNQIYPSLSLAAAAHFLDLKPQDIIAESNQVRLGNRVVPLDKNGEAWINWAGGNRTFPTYSFNELFDGRVPAESLKGRIVLIGTTAAGTFEYRATPFSTVQPAIELQANALDDILMNRPLQEAPPWLQLSLLFGFALLTGALTSPRRALGGTIWIFGSGVILWRVAVWALDQHNTFLPVMEPFLAGALTFGVTTALNYRQEWEANWRADAAVATLARGGAVMASGHDRDRLQVEIRATAREALQAREVFLVLHETAPTGMRGDSLLHEIVQQVVAGKSTLLWPLAADYSGFHQNGDGGDNNMSPEKQPAAPKKSKWLSRASSNRNSKPTASLNGATDIKEKSLFPLLEKLCAELDIQDASTTLLPVLRHGTHTVVAAPLPRGKGNPDEAPEGERRFSGALVAVGRRDGHPFTARDATLLETLAEQAGLALENLEYYEILRRRIALANRDLQDAYQLLAEQSTKLYAAIESIDDALIISDEENDALFVNAATSRVLLDAVPQLGESVPEVLRDCGLLDLADLFEKIKHNDNPLDIEKICAEASRSTAANETPRILSAQLTPLVSDDQRKLGAMLVVADVTAQRELDKMKSDFIGFVAHELRTPLTSILGYASLLQTAADKVSAEQRGEMTEVIMRHCRRLDRMVSELLDVSRLQAGRGITLRREAANLAELCQRVLDDQKTALRYSQKIELKFECCEQPLLAYIDPDRMEQVIINLVSNAVKYSPQGGTVTLSLCKEADTITLSVTDTGMGMSEEQMGQLFQRFYRTPDAIARGIKGTGLGLYLVKQLVEAHEGRIDVTSRAGRGTTFSVTLPQQIPAGKDEG